MSGKTARPNKRKKDKKPSNSKRLAHGSGELKQWEWGQISLCVAEGLQGVFAYAQEAGVDFGQPNSEDQTNSFLRTPAGQALRDVTHKLLLLFTAGRTKLDKVSKKNISLEILAKAVEGFSFATESDLQEKSKARLKKISERIAEIEGKINDPEKVEKREDLEQLKHLVSNLKGTAEIIESGKEAKNVTPTDHVLKTLVGIFTHYADPEPDPVDLGCQIEPVLGNVDPKQENFHLRYAMSGDNKAIALRRCEKLLSDPSQKPASTEIAEIRSEMPNLAIILMKLFDAEAKRDEDLARTLIKDAAKTVHDSLSEHIPLPA